MASSIAKYTLGCAFQRAFFGVGQHSGKSLWCTVCSRSGCGDSVDTVCKLTFYGDKKYANTTLAVWLRYIEHSTVAILLSSLSFYALFFNCGAAHWVCLFIISTRGASVHHARAAKVQSIMRVYFLRGMIVDSRICI